MAVLGQRPFFARPDKRDSVLLRASSPSRGHRPFFARPDKQGSVLLELLELLASNV